ncbi:MAG: hypothetical protein ACPL7I_07345, partial [Myxococcota bacterium]
EGYITTIGGGGGDSSRDVPARDKILVNPLNIVYVSYDKEISEEGIGVENVGIKEVYFSDGEVINRVENPIAVLARGGKVRWDEANKRYEGDKGFIWAVYNKENFPYDAFEWRQVVCREGMSGRYMGGVFDTRSGCNKFGGEYISSDMIADKVEMKNYDSPSTFDRWLTNISSNHPANYRFYIGIKDSRTDKERYFRYVDIPFSLDSNALEVEAGIQIGITNSVIDLSNGWDLFFNYIKYEDIPHICPEKDEYEVNGVKYKSVIDTCYIDNYGYMRIPSKIIPIMPPTFYKECFYHILKNKNTSEENKILKRCVNLRCTISPPPSYKYSCEYVKGSEKEEIIENNIRDGSENDYSDGSFQNIRLARLVLSGLIDKFLDRMENRNMSTIQITYEGALSKGCKGVNNCIGDSCDVIECAEDQDKYEDGEDKYPIIIPQVPAEIKNLIIDVLLEKSNKRGGVIKNIFIKPSLMPEMRLYRYNENAEYYLDKNNLFKNIGPFSKDSYSRINSIQMGYVEDNRLNLWDVRGKNNLSIGWEDILKIDKERLISLKNGDVDNLYTDFYTGKIITCGPKFGTVNESGQDFYRSKIFEGCESINIDDGLNCELQDRYGIYNYYCFLWKAVRKGRDIKESHPEINVYISLSNDHVFPVLPLTRIRIEGKNIIEKLRSECSECKFTNGMAWN